MQASSGLVRIPINHLENSILDEAIKAYDEAIRLNSSEPSSANTMKPKRHMPRPKS
jgi:hypothetical protein